MGILRGHTQSSLFEARGMKIWSTPHSDMGRPVNYNGPKVINPVVVRRELPLGMVTCRCAAGYMLETPSIRRYFFGSDNPFGAGNQQERPRWYNPVSTRNPQRPYAGRTRGNSVSRRDGPSLMATWGLTRAKFLVG